MSNIQASTMDEKLRYSLDLQAHQIDSVLDYHQVEGSVTSGTVRPRIVEFDVQAPLSAGLEKMRGLRDSMMAALGVRDLALTKQDGRWQLRLDRAAEPQVSLPRMLADLSVPPGTAVIGMTDSNQPVLLRFGQNDVRHVLVAGDEGAGKSTLLRTIATSLAITNRQCDVQLLLIAGAPELPNHGSMLSEVWRPLSYLPHLMTDVVDDAEVAAEVLHFLVGEMTYRRQQRVQMPRIVVLIDNVVALLEAGGRALSDNFLRLLQHGNSVGIHLIMATARPDSAALDVLFMSNLSVRLVGRLSDPGSAHKILGDIESHVAYLQGAGEFIALAGGKMSYFQAADLSDYDLHWELNRMLNGSRPRLLAQPYVQRPGKSAEVTESAAPQTFKRENGVQWIEPAVNTDEVESDLDELDDEPLPWIDEEASYDDDSTGE